MQVICIAASGIAIRAKKLLLLSTTLIFSLRSAALPKTWTGLGGDGRWSTAANWNNGSLPGAADDVLLDNSAVTSSYTVTLPNSAVSIRSLRLSPPAGMSIVLLLPSTNTVAPALSVSGPGYGILIDKGGVFRNESGLSAGASLSIADSIRINSGGRYVHGSRSPSASSIVQLLSKAAGSEKGVFEYDVPGTANYDVSVTKRVYGTLVLSAAASGSSRVYTGSGANQLTINGDLIINTGVTFKTDLSGSNGNIVVRGDYMQNGGVFNMAAGPNTTILYVAGNLQQLPGASITETDAGTPVVELSGSSRQSVLLQGSINNSVSVRINNPAGAVLLSPLSLPWQLDLVKGIVSSSYASLLTLMPGCGIHADSSSSASYIDGPLRKEGLQGTDHFLFPVGAAGQVQWVMLRQATGNFTVSYAAADPHAIGNGMDSSVADISSLGYWTIGTDATPVRAAQVELIYRGPNNAGIADMSVARVAQLSGNVWTSRGNAGTTGSAGSVGSVISLLLQPMVAGISVFTIASASQVRMLGIGYETMQDSVHISNRIRLPSLYVSSHAGRTALKVKAKRAGSLRVSLYTISGAKVADIHTSVAAINVYTTVAIPPLPHGIYVARVCDAGGSCAVGTFIQ